jgi:hypothetical protein
MQTFMNFKSGHAYRYAAMIRSWIHGEDSLFDVRDFFDPAKKAMLEKALNPNKKTLLHDLIELAIEIEMEYMSSKAGEMVAPDYCELLTKYEVPFIAEASFDDEDYYYAQYLFAQIREHVLPGLTAEVFNLLFQDRGVLKAFNALIAERVVDMEQADYPDYLKRDGVFIRCNYWPSWLKDGLTRRDKGHCAICQCDVSGLLARDADVHIDHIIPLNLGGVNDPTNLQLLCDKCNGAKGGDATTTTEMVPNFW